MCAHYFRRKAQAQRDITAYALGVMRKMFRIVLLATTGGLLILSLLYAALWTRSEIGGDLLAAMHILVIVNGVFVGWFLRPYEKWLWNKPGRYTQAGFVILVACALSSWILSAMGVAWAPIELFFSFVWSALLLAMFTGLWHLPRVRKYNS
ncbi:hypothetical protein KS2013_41 [Kangiella sediminilitoris]|uniref:Transmembrane protein n=1 Tax=Kangiella sediminilitoris TaxID=1144748 RepID=A0A1B3B7L6_9GAMM|nr:hypothetical protein KS2013_41 [Kangiella sediminilitoris]